MGGVVRGSHWQPPGESGQEDDARKSENVTEKKKKQDGGAPPEKSICSWEGKPTIQERTWRKRHLKKEKKTRGVTLKLQTHVFLLTTPNS